MTVRYDSAVGDGGGETPGARALRSHWRAVSGLGSLGIYNPRRIRGGSGWSVHAEGRAFDAAADATDPDELAAADRWVRFLIEHAADLQMPYLIWNRRDWLSGPGWTLYGGSHPHRDHVHVELNWIGAKGVTRAQLDRLWAAWPGSQRQQEDDEMHAYWTKRIEYRYRHAGRNPHHDPAGMLYWAERVALALAAGDDPAAVEAEAVGLLERDNTAKAKAG